MINTATNTILATINVGSFPNGVALNAAGTRAYVTSGGGDSVSVINTATNAVVATIAVGNTPSGVAVGPTGTYVANVLGDSVSVINTATNTVTASIAVGDRPDGVAVNPAGTSPEVFSLWPGFVFGGRSPYLIRIYGEC